MRGGQTMPADESGGPSLRIGTASSPRKRVLVLAMSPHAEGTAARAASLAAEGARRAGAKGELLELWRRRVSGCLDCGSCAQPPFVCPQGPWDDAEHVFEALSSADLVLWLSPVYFYGLPSQAKALVDRAQRLYAGKTDGNPVPRGRWAALLLAGRKRGEKLFLGSSLALSYFFSALGKEKVEMRGLRGAERPDQIDAALSKELALSAASLAGDANDPLPFSQLERLS